jgi:DNA-binding MarR family transcriptional regulator
MSDKLVELVNLWHTFEKENPRAEIQDFCKSYMLGTDNNNPVEVKFTEDNPKEKILGRALNRLHKISLFYSKKRLAALELKNLEDFVYLKNLMDMGPLSKKQLIDMHIGEYSSGIEIIKRLINLGLVKEKPHTDDKRSTAISITVRGRGTLQKCYPYMQEIGKLVFDPLTEKESQQLIYLLSKLDTIHTNIYKNSRDSSIEELQKMIKVIGK